MQRLLEELRLWPLIDLRAELTPEALCAKDERGRRLSFAGYRDACLRVAAGLAELGVGAGTAVSWQLPTWLESLVLVGALARLGARQNPILPFLREREVGFITRQTGAQLLLVPPVFRGFDHAAMAHRLADGQPELRVQVIDRTLPEADPASLEPFPTAAKTDDVVRWIFYSSGTTADPKGVRHTDASLARPGRALVERLALRPRDCNALVFPFTHIGGLNWLFAGLYAGCAHVLVEAFDPEASPALLSRCGVTVAGAGTVFHQAYLAAQRAHPEQRLLPQVRVFPGGGAPKPPDLHETVKRELGGAGVVSGYGLTEHPIATMASIGDPDEKLAATEGRATPGTLLRIVRADGALARVGEEGEIRLRGPHLFRGYVDAALDRKAFDAEGFLRTGDLGRIDAEGFLVVTGRLKDVIIRKGENISAKELEDQLFAHAEVADVAVLGLPDEERGERACAVVVPRDPAQPPDLEALTTFLADRGVARPKHPEQLEIVEVLPRNASGKVLKTELRRRFAGRREPVSR